MIRETLKDLISVCRQIKTAYNATSYEIHDYDDRIFADFRLMEVDNIEELANLTKGYKVSIFAEMNTMIVRIHENYQGE